ncbi:MAG: YdcF family protein [Candidatus Puniceispirillales bacterium]
MMIYLHKLLPMLISPLGLSLGLILLFILTRRRIYGIVGCFILFVAAMPITGNTLMKHLESGQTLQSPEHIPDADAVVVLSGMMRRIPMEDGIRMEWGEAADRIFAGINVMKTDKAPVLILTRGLLPWHKGVAEGDMLAEEAIKAGIPNRQILLTDIVVNTAEEAKAVKLLMPQPQPSIILVTSAFHMPRAMHIFEANGFTVIPYAVDFRSADNHISILTFIPNASGLNDTSFAIREFIGRIWYAVRY